MASNNKKTEIEETISTIQDEPQQIDAIRSIRGWFGPSQDSPYYPLVQKYLQGNIDLTETVSKLSEYIDGYVSEKKDVDYIDLLWGILHSAKRISWRDTEYQTKLVKLVKRLKNPESEDVDYFYGIPDWGMAVREVLNDSPGVGSGYSVPEAHAWANLSYFLARIDKEKLWGGFEPLYSLWELREALERPEKDDGENDAHEPGTLVEKLNARVPAAAVWIIVLGKDLYEFEKDMTPTEPGRGNPAKGGELWKGKAEFSKERWAFWKKRFGEIGQKEKLRKETRDIAIEAVEAMDNAEGS